MVMPFEEVTTLTFERFSSKRENFIYSILSLEEGADNMKIEYGSNVSIASKLFRSYVFCVCRE